ncbi:MAG: ATP-grasp fold amidoligase family protein [Bacteroidales bacterium]|nr:ATP-grasp fold amidoligase family protein [Bacteroidales bacterium]
MEWLKIYSDTTQWTDLADKYKVREYVRQCGLKEILVELHGVWRNAEEIDFDKLPDAFVLKTNHGFRKTMLIHNKSHLDITQTRSQLNKWLSERYGLISFEPHYWNIERLIMAEELLEDDYNASVSSSLIDYKFTCIHGKPEFVVVIAGRENITIGSEQQEVGSGMRAGVYDLDWQPRSEVINGGFFSRRFLLWPYQHLIIWMK